MRVFIAMVAVLVATPAWADLESELSYGTSERWRDEITARHPPMNRSLRTVDDVENYVRQRDEYDQAVQRLTLDELRQMRKEQKKEQQQRELDDAIRNMDR